MKKLVAIFCLFILCLQVVPVKQIGAMLFNNLITEEIAHTADCAKHTTLEKETADYLPAYFSYACNILSVTNNHSIHAHTALVKLHVAEVQTPPPDLV